MSPIPLQLVHVDPTVAPADGDVPVYDAASQLYIPTAAGAGNVTAAGTLTSNQVVIGQGTTAVATLGSLGTTTTVLHGNAAGAPTFATVVEADITLANNTTNDVTTSAHGFAPKGTTGTTQFWRQDWTLAAPSGAGNVSTSATLTSGKLVIGAGTTAIDISATTATVTKLTSGTPSAATDGTDYVSPTTQRVVQVVNTQTGEVATGTTTIPADDTIPQNTEGTEFMTLAITPTSATNKLKIDVTCILACATAIRNMCVALFQDSGADAIAVADQAEGTGGFMFPINFSHYMTSGTTSATTFKVRAGVETSGTVTFNGSGGARFYGGKLASSITITEIKV